jgi:F plasmid transfer operon, TraF, protein
MSRVLAGMCLIVLVPAAATAQQVFESVGGRALGMAGAFVAVADDPSATYWNPAGLASAGPAGATIGWVRFRTRDRTGPVAPGPSLRTSKFVSLGTWPIGVSYARLESAILVRSPDDSTSVEVLRTSQIGATILQSVVQGLVVGSTLKYALDRASGLEGRTRGAFDLDLGVMMDMQRVRVGVTTRNLRQPSFTDPAGTAMTLARQSRLGLAVFPVGGLTLAMDLDLNTVGLRDGLRRMIAFGGEDRLGARLAVRGGLRWNLEGDRRTVLATGVSVAIRPNTWVDGHVTWSQFDGDRGFGIALRAGY